MGFNVDKILTEWSYRVPNGTPDLKNAMHVVELQNVLEERKFSRQFIEALLGRMRMIEDFSKMTVKQQKKYLQKHPGSKKKITAKPGKKAATDKDVKGKRGKKDKPSGLTKQAKEEKKRLHKQIHDDPKAAKEILKNKDKYPEGSEERALAMDTHRYAREVEDAELEGRDPIPRDSAVWKALSSTAAASNARRHRIATDPDRTAEEKERDFEALRQTGESYDLYNPLKKAMINNGYGEEVEVYDEDTGEVVRMKSEDILKRFVNEFQNITEKLSTEDKKAFSDYLKNPTLEFDPSNTGNLFEKAAGSGIPPAILNAIMRHTTQDSGKKGVGMGEFAMTMIFTNIKNASAKGDLGLIVKQPDGTTIEKPFELKGQGATLGAKPDTFKSSQATRDGFGVTEEGGKFSIEINGETKTYAKNQTNQLLADKYNSLETDEERDAFKANFKRMIVNDGHGVGAKVAPADKPWEGEENGQDLYDAFMSDPDLEIDFSDPDSIGNTIGLLNYVGYAMSDGHTEFAAHDMGAADEKASKKDSINQGNYVRAGTDHPEGTRAAALDMVKQLKENCMGFERVSFENVRPRVGLGKGVGRDGKPKFTRPPGCK